METYEIIIKIETQKSKGFPTNEPKVEKDGTVRMVITEEEALELGRELNKRVAKRYLKKRGA